MDNVMEGQLTENKQEFTEPELESLRRKYKAQDGRIYEVTTTIQEDDEEEKTFTFLFRKPGTASYERYVKLSSNSAVKALKTFVLDNICEEQYKKLEAALRSIRQWESALGRSFLTCLDYLRIRQ